MHYLQSADLPPGAIGTAQLVRGGPLAGYFQPVEVRGPQGAKVALEIGGLFEPSVSDTVMAGMLIGQVYRLKVTEIPRNEGAEVFPTVEVINRLYPPPGKATKFPIPIELTQHEIELALSGQYVVRVIYLEDPNQPLPTAELAEQRYFEAAPGQDPLKVADELGRPMAILRMGSRVPDLPSESELRHSPPLIRFPPPPEPVRPGGPFQPDDPVQPKEPAQLDEPIANQARQVQTASNVQDDVQDGELPEASEAKVIHSQPALRLGLPIFSKSNRPSTSTANTGATVR